MEDLIIIGGGVCGCSLLYALSRYKVSVLLIEKENDVACGTTKANSGIVHAGYDPEPGTAMARFNVEGNALVEKLSADLDINFKKTGSLVIGFNEAEKKTIQRLLENGLKNNVPGIKIIFPDEIFRLEPNVNRDVICALYAPSAGIIAPWELAFVQAECAVQSAPSSHEGARVALDCEVTAIKKEHDFFTVITTKGEYTSRFVVNAAGVESDLVSRMVEPEFFSITPKNGEYYLLDTTESNLVKTIVFPCPSELGKGVLVAPTVHDNIIIGPNSRDTTRNDLTTTQGALDFIRTKALRSVPSINFRTSIRNFTGIRADAGLDDFIVGESTDVPGFFNIAAIKSPGLSAAPAIAQYIAGKLLEKGLCSERNPHFVAKRRVTRFAELSDAEKSRIIRENPLYGSIVCRCRTLTEGEIVDALNRPLPPRSVDGIKRRCTAGSGRCQGGFCSPKVLDLIARHYHIPHEKVPLDKEGMYIVTGHTKQGTSA